MSKQKTRIDKTYIAPQLTVREKAVTGLYTLLDLSFFLYVLGTAFLVFNLFSPTYPWRHKLVNLTLLLIGLALIGAIVYLIFK